MNLQPLDPGGGNVTHQEIHVNKTTSAKTRGAIIW
jgi:hypothetical protein